MKKTSALAAAAALGLSGCAAVQVPVKAAGTVAGTGLSAAGHAVLLVTRDTSILR
ncbi:hypothetical protein [Palleronia abyssalis]|uniref:Lipoprotein n=1 Tax=Palleronia abyssalis TaxID=1501240 RepID=A0A2R8BQ39_9RHOB|nr:hypothetical protein [Palleronia abyssalis]SPJ22270.1 hypothetical protein PAA8504_00058 [Palleronia abyssalis]